jgi:transcriptional regulator with XRE-family HTH domain
MRNQRNRLNLSQDRVSESLGISKATLSEMETGHIAFSLERWLNWCAVLKLSPVDVLKKWEMSEAYAEITKERRNGFHKLVDNMIKYGFSFQLDSWMGFFNNLVQEEKQKRRIEESKRKIKKYFPKVQ